MNQLRHREEIENLLRDYRISETGKALLKELRLVLLCGPTASGRNTIIGELLKNGNYSFIVSDTTRQPRVNNGVKEKNGVAYWFRSEEEVIEELRRGEFLEAEIIHDQQLSGISLRELRKAHMEGKIAINDIDIGGFNNVTSVKPDTVGILILPPSFEEWLSRLTGRGEMPKEEVVNRLETGKRIFSDAIVNTNAILVVNDNLEETVKEVDRLAHGGVPEADYSKMKLAEDLIKQTERYLNHL